MPTWRITWAELTPFGFAKHSLEFSRARRPLLERRAFLSPGLLVVLRYQRFDREALPVPGGDGKPSPPRFPFSVLNLTVTVVNITRFSPPPSYLPSLVEGEMDF